MRHKWHREAEMKARRISHQRVAGRQVGMQRERRLHVSEGRYDDTPNAFDGVERQYSFVSLDQTAHHLGLAYRAERRAGFLAFLDRDQPVDDVAALHQQPVHPVSYTHLTLPTNREV